LDTIHEPATEHAALATSLAEQGVEVAAAAWLDVVGRPKSKFVPIHNLPGMLAGSERYTPRGMGNLGRMNPSEDECVAVPDPSTMRVLTWDPRIAFFNADLLYGGNEPFANCPRSNLKAVTRRAEELGYRFMLGVETEFYVFRREALPDLEPIAPSSTLWPTPAYDVESTIDSLDLLTEIARHMAAADFGLFSFDHEGGNGQYELDFAHAEVLRQCDQLVYLRLLLRHVAREHGCFVTFMPKPRRTAWGSGAHMNMSLESLTGTNQFLEVTDDGKRVWTSEAYGFVAGLLRHAPALSALTCPSVNSYKRLVPRLADGSVSWAPVWAAYGDNNRSCMLRLPANRPAIENRSVDMTANMYLAAAFSLAAGLDGIERGLDPGEPVQDDTSSWIGAREHQARRLPRTLLEAIDAFEEDPLVQETFPDHFIADYTAMKREEWEEYHAEVSQWEIDRYLLNV
jgi:glutamine synthetase